MFDFFIIIPCFNESKRLDINSFYQFSLKNKNYKLLFVNDGSTDQTLTILEKLSLNSQNISFLSYEKNMGKAYAVRYGVLNVLENLANSNSYIGFLDADLSISTKEIDLLYKSAIVNKELSFVYYMKNKSEYYNNKFLRYQASNLLKKINEIVYNLKIEDTQCGCKIFKYDIAKIVFKDKFVSKWLFDLEIFLRFINIMDLLFLDNHTLGIKNNKIYHSKKSKIKYFIFLQIIIDYIRIFRRYKPVFKKIDN